MPKPFDNLFKLDRILRDKNRKPIGRVILSSTYSPGDKRILCVLLVVPKVFSSGVRGQHFWIDEREYRVAKDTPDVRFSEGVSDWKVNTFYLEEVEKEKKQ